MNRKPVSKVLSGAFIAVFFFVNHIIFVALESQSNSHIAIIIGAYISYKVLIHTTQKNKIKQNIDTANSSQIVRQKKPLSKFKKSFVIFLGFWVFWVFLRTFFEFQFIGMDLYNWDEDFLLINLFAPPILYLLVWYIYDWIFNGTQK